MARIGKAYDLLIDGAAYLAGLLIVGMSLWITYEVFVRYVLLSPTIWAADLSGYALLWATFLAAPWVLKRNGHVSIELATDRLSPARRRRVAVAVSLVGAIISAIFAWQTAVTTYEFFDQGRMMARIWQIPLFIPYVCMPLGAALLAVEFLRRAFATARTGDPDGIDGANAARRTMQ